MTILELKYELVKFKVPTKHTKKLNKANMRWLMRNFLILNRGKDAEQLFQKIVSMNKKGTYE